jgi:protein transport protein SEC24
MMLATSVGSLGQGAVHSRMNRDTVNKPEEGPKIMSPASSFYSDQATHCNGHRIAVDLFFGLNDKVDIDLATVAPVCGNTGGDLTFYQPFDVNKHGEKLYYSLFRILTRPTGSEVAVKARCSTGLSVTQYLGSHINYQLADFVVAQTDSDKTFTMLLRNDEKLGADRVMHLQFAMLYTD